jgi:hypothetical protein
MNLEAGAYAVPCSVPRVLGHYPLPVILFFTHLPPL